MVVPVLDDEDDDLCRRSVRCTDRNQITNQSLLLASSAILKEFGNFTKLN